MSRARLLAAERAASLDKTVGHCGVQDTDSEDLYHEMLLHGYVQRARPLYNTK